MWTQSVTHFCKKTCVFWSPTPATSIPAPRYRSALTRQQACRLANAAPPAVPPSPDPLPGLNGSAWRQLLERRTPRHFPAADGQPLSRLQAAVESWSWEHIAEGLGAHVQGFRGPPGEHAFPYYEGNMPLEGVRASHTLRRTAEPGMYSGAELVRGIRGPTDGGRLLYASQSLIRLNPDGSPDERALARGPMPPIGAELTDALREMASGWPEGRMGSASLWLGHAGSVTPLHFDTNHNVYVQLHGLKRVQLLPPSAATRAHLYPSLHPTLHTSLFLSFSLSLPLSWSYSLCPSLAHTRTRPAAAANCCIKYGPIRPRNPSHSPYLLPRPLPNMV